MTEPHVTDYSPGRHVVFDRGRAFLTGVIVKNHDGMVVIDMGEAVTRTSKDRVVGTFARVGTAVDLAHDLNLIERTFYQRRATVLDWRRDARSEAIAEARAADAA